MTDATPPLPSDIAPPVQPDVGDLIAKAVTLRDLIKEKNEQHTEAMKPFTEAFDQLENYLLGVLGTAGVSNMKMKGKGTISALDKYSSPVDDPAAFQDFVITEQRWELVNMAANTPAVQDYLKNNNALPPGVRLTTYRKLGLRRPSKTDSE